jgi:2-dehydro-3-deoxygalactonokinase
LNATSPSLVALDWGTSSLRALLLDSEGNVLDSRVEPWGTMYVPRGDFAAAFDAVTAEWRLRQPGLNAISAGMIGSTMGWIEAPYCAAPAGAEELAAALTALPDAALYIVPGLAMFGERAEVMRGEETQIVGALELHPELASRSLLVLPGTHSKWVNVNDGRVSDFTTYMTGELFAVLRNHSTLGRLATKTDHDANHGTTDEMNEAFARGVIAAQRSVRGLAPMLFSARALVLTQRLPAELSLEYLSGLLIGEELRCGLRDGAPPAALIGDAALCGRYTAALRLFEIYDVPIVDRAAHTGLWSIARRAGLPLASGAMADD